MCARRVVLLCEQTRPETLRRRIQEGLLMSMMPFTETQCLPEFAHGQKSGVLGVGRGLWRPRVIRYTNSILKSSYYKRYALTNYISRSVRSKTEIRTPYPKGMKLYLLFDAEQGSVRTMPADREKIMQSAMLGGTANLKS